MAGIFISHSSHDKPFVRKLAGALLGEGLPVWLDSWELNLGDSLAERLDQGIGSSSLLIVVVSQKSVASGWVERELRLALEREQKIGRKFVLPLQLDECAPPSFMDERVFADFRHSFSYPFTGLVSALEAYGVRTLKTELSRELLCLSFTNATNLDMAKFSKNMDWIRKRHPEATIQANQIKIADDEDYLRLKQRLHDRIDRVAEDKFYSPEFEQELKMIPVSIAEEERILAEGVASIVNDGSGSFALREALFWFTKFVRSRLCFSLYRAQNPEQQIIPFGQECFHAYIYNAEHMAKFYGTNGVIQVDAWSTKFHPDYESIYIGIEQFIDAEHRDRRSIPYASGLERYCRNDAYSKYVLPQALYRTLKQKNHKGVWRQEDVIIGPH